LFLGTAAAALAFFYELFFRHAGEVCGFTNRNAIFDPVVARACNFFRMQRAVQKVLSGMHNGPLVKL
jgi:hypothetical protein